MTEEPPFARQLGAEFTGLEQLEEVRRLNAELHPFRILTSIEVDILGHCTGRIVVGRGRPESDFDPEAVFGACARYDTAVEINCRPDRLDPPSRLLHTVAPLGCRVAINTDAHAVGQLDWQPYGSVRAADAGIDEDDIVNTWPLDRLLAWTAGHAPSHSPPFVKAEAPMFAACAARERAAPQQLDRGRDARGRLRRCQVKVCTKRWSCSTRRRSIGIVR